MQEFFKTESQEDIDKKWLTQLCWDGQMEDDEIPEFVEAVIIWKDKSISEDLTERKKKLIEWVNKCEDFDKRDARIMITEILR